MTKIKEIPREERPIEKLTNIGVKNLNNQELLAILLNTGTKELSSKELAEKLLIEVNGIENLKNITLNQLLKVKGIGIKKASTILSAIELSKRMTKKINYKDKITNPKILANYFKELLKDELQEYFYVVYLNTQKQILEIKCLFKGTLNYSLVHPREIFKYAYLNSASSIILIHNHPTGDVTPSKEDIKLTEEIENIGYIHEIKVNDHIIIGKDKYYSFLTGKEDNVWKKYTILTFH